MGAFAVAATTFAMALATLAPLPALAGIPAAIDGEPLPTLAPMIKRVTPAVVNIATMGRVRVRENPLLADPFFRRFFNLPPATRGPQTQSVGSGVIVDAEAGFILTNHHVIANADRIVVTLRDRRQFEATLVGSDPDTDIAVLTIQAENLQALPMGDSDELEVGDFVVAIGNPFGIGQTVTSGIVSALRRSGLGIEGFEDFIQTDASINPGNSGGALVTLRGDLIGINTAIIGPSGGNVGIGFAIPVNMVRRLMDQLITYGSVQRGRLGVQAQDLTPGLADAMGLASREGAVITKVTPESPAEEAGLRVGDVVIEVDGGRVHSSVDLRNRVGLLRIGESIEMVLLREGEKLKIRATVVEPGQLQLGEDSPVRQLAGATFAPIEESSPLFGHVEGVQVVKVERASPAWNIGLRKHDVVIGVNRERVRNREEFAAAARRNSGSLLLKVLRGDAQIFIVVR